MFDRCLHLGIEILPKYGAHGVAAFAAAVVAALIIGYRLMGFCNHEKGVLPVIPRLLGGLLFGLGVVAIFAVWSVLAFVRSYIPAYAYEYRPGALERWWHWVVSYRIHTYHGIAAGVFVGILGWFMIGRWVEPWFASILHLATRKHERDSLTDARSIQNYLPKQRQYDPRKYFDGARKRNAIFLGLDEIGRPVYVPRDKFCETHVQILGPTGTGKGVAASVILSQCIRYGDAVIVLEPKGDDWLPLVLHEQCKEVGAPFYLLDLRSTVPLFNLFAGATATQINELLQAGFSLGSSGKESDHYRKYDRKAAKALSQDEDSRRCVAQMCDEALRVLGTELAKAANGFLEQLEELATLSVIQTASGFDLKSFVERGGCLYIIGSEGDEATKTLQRMLLVRFVQILKERDLAKTQRHAVIFLDEFKHHISPQALSALGMIRSKGANIIVSHQSLGDLTPDGMALDAKSVEGAVLDNTQIKLAYGNKDKDTAEWISGLTGTILVRKERLNISRNDALAEFASGDRTADLVERPLVDVNMVQHLPPGCAVVVSFFIEHAKLIFTAFIPVTKSKLRGLPPAPLYKRRATDADPFHIDPTEDSNKNNGGELL